MTPPTLTTERQAEALSGGTPCPEPDRERRDWVALLDRNELAAMAFSPEIETIVSI